MQRSARNRLTWIFIAFATLPGPAICAPASTAFCDVRYEAIDLGSFSEFNRSSAYAINNRGHVTGNSAQDTFLWSCEAGLENIGRTIDRPDNVGVAINDRDQVVVMIAPEYPQVLPDTVLWQRNTAPAVIVEQQEFYPDSITNSGVVTFFGSMWSKATGHRQFEIGVPIAHAFLTNLGRLGGTYFDEAAFATRLFTWTRRDGVKTLGPPIPDSAYVVDTNDRGDLLVSAASTELRTAFIIDRSGQVQMLPLQSDARILYGARVNLAREVIGQEVATAVQPHGDFSRSYVWSATHGYRNLNALFATTPGNSFEPTSINDWGWIVGNRRDFNASLLVPVPAHMPRFQHLQRLPGPQLCRALAEVKVHRLLCSLGGAP